MRVEGPWQVRAQPLLALLGDAGHQALMVGGCVRNALLGAPVGDVDIATDARPEQVLALAEAAGIRAVPTGLVHGTVTLVQDGQGHEVTTFRRDAETDGRHARVEFSQSLAEDAARRDFTMNALYARADGQVLDPLGGLPDLRARRVRFVGDPAARIAEDYLRILRFFRFQAQYGDPEMPMDAAALEACAAGAGGLARLSAERIGAEMRKLLAAPDPAPAVAAMDRTGVLAQVLPGGDSVPLGRLVALEGDLPPGALRRLLALGGDAGRLRLTRAEGRALATARTALAGDAPPAELGYRLGAEAARDVVLVRAARDADPPPPDWQAQVARGAAACFPLRARDLPGLEGPALGAALREREARWIASDFTLDRAALLR